MQAREGFTLVELLVVVLIIGALAAVVIPRITAGAEGAKINACRTNVQIINRQIEKFKQDTGTWPNNFKDLARDPNYFPDGPPRCPFGTPYEIHGSMHRIKRHHHLLTSETSWVQKHIIKFW